MVITPFHSRKIIEVNNQRLTTKSRICAEKCKELAQRGVKTIYPEGRKRLADVETEQQSVNLLTKNQ